MITMKPTETQLTLLLLLLPVVFLILLVVGVMSPQKIQQACLWSWRLLQVQKGMMLHLHSWFKHSAFHVRTIGCWKSAIFTENQEHWMLSYVFLTEWSKSTLLRNVRAWRSVAMTRWDLMNSELTLSGKGTRVFHLPRCLICSKAAENVWRHWWKLGDAWTFKSGKEEAEATTRDWKGVMFDEVCTATSDIANYIKLSGEKWCVCQFVSLSLSLFVPFIPKSCHPRCCALHQRWLRWSWGCPAPNAGTAAQCVGFVNSSKDKKSHWFSWATSVKSLFLIVFTYPTLYSGVFYLRRDENSMCMQQPQKQAKTAKTRRNERLGAKLQKIVTLPCMSVSLALCWWQLYPAARKDTTTNLL